MKSRPGAQQRVLELCQVLDKSKVSLNLVDKSGALPYKHFFFVALSLGVELSLGQQRELSKKHGNDKGLIRYLSAVDDLPAKRRIQLD